MTTTHHNAKGPASAATDPDHGSTIPSEGNIMNTLSNSMEKTNSAINSISIDLQPTANLDGYARLGLYEAFATIGNALSGFLSQPRSDGVSDDQPYNEAGEIIADLVEYFDRLRSSLVEVVADRPCDDPGENEKRLFLMLQHEVSFTGELQKCAAMASQFVFEQAELERTRRRAAFVLTRNDSKPSGTSDILQLGDEIATLSDRFDQIKRKVGGQCE